MPPLQRVDQPAPEPLASSATLNTQSSCVIDQAAVAWLIANGRLKKADAERSRLLEADQQRQDQVEKLSRLGLVSEQDVAAAWSGVLNVPLLRSSDAPAPDVAAMPELSVRFLRHHCVMPLILEGSRLKVIMANPALQHAIDALSYACQRPVQVVVGVRSEIDQLIERYFGQGRTAMDSLFDNLAETKPDQQADIEHLKDLASEAPVIRLVNLIMQRAIEQRASDIHIEPYENLLKVRYRVDGVLLLAESPPASSSAAVISRIKIMAKLDIAERRLPQDGRIMLRVEGRELDLRVSTAPTGFGESVVIRLLDRQTVAFDFSTLGFVGEHLAAFLEVLERPHGIVLVTGPTGSGKTTTLYTALSRLNTEERKIITVEDPVEYQIEGINQIQVKPAIGLDFAGILRSIVRQDPDVIMIGEMRDLETCRIAIQSSLTGHLVLSTLHTNSAAASITRLLDMGVESYLIASTVNGILAQRLVRRLIPEWSEPFEASPELIAEHQLDMYTDERPIMLYRPKQSAPDNGYRGRSALTELLIMNEDLRSLLMRHADAVTLENAARASGLRTLYEDGLRQALAGITSLEEVLRVTRSE